MGSFDPDDPSDYEDNEDDRDNRNVSYQYGTLSGIEGTTVVAGTEVNHGGNLVEGAFRNSGGSGEFKLKLKTSETHSGENYEVRASFYEDLDEIDREGEPKQFSARLTTWKRYYVEVDRMVRADAEAKIEYSVGEGATSVIVSSHADFIDNDTVEFVSSDGSRESRAITKRVQGSDLYMDFASPLTKHFSNQTSVVVKPSTSEVWEANTSKIEEMLSHAFVECKFRSNGCETIPYLPIRLTDGMSLVPFKFLKDTWFDNRNEDYYLYVVGMDQHWNDPVGVYGQARVLWNMAMTYGKTIDLKSDWNNNEWTATGEICAHEFGHASTADGLNHCPGGQHDDNVHESGKPCGMKSGDDVGASAQVDGSVCWDEDHVWSLRDSAKP